ncbi:MAG: leucyl aminopeptidase family protein, partial [Pseudomonadota bacterium]
MTALTFAENTGDAIPLSLVTVAGLPTWKAATEDGIVAYAANAGFTARSGDVLVVRDAAGAVIYALVGLGTPKDRARSRFVLGGAREKLPEGTYRLAHTGGADVDEAALGWLLSGYRFGRYKSATPPKAALIAPEGVDAARIEALAAGEALTRDLINTPASDMGPEELEGAARTLAKEHGALCDVITGDALLDQNFPMIHTVGRASTRAPRLIDMRWGSAGPKLTLVGKGVCFDTGGLNLKPGGSMGLMK